MATEFENEDYIKTRIQLESSTKIRFVISGAQDE